MLKTKIVLSILTLLLAGVLIGGGTMAWFTAEAVAEPAVFKAATLEIAVDGAYILDGPDNMNWTPGDTNAVEWDIYNTGTAAMEFRVNMGGTWTFYDEENNVIADPVAYFDAFNSEEDIYASIAFGLSEEADPADWAFAGDYLYYLGGPVEAGDFVTLPLTVTLDGEMAGNEFQRAEYELSGVVEALQASNGAPSEIWGEEWDNLQ